MTWSKEYTIEAICGGKMKENKAGLKKKLFLVIGKNFSARISDQKRKYEKENVKRGDRWQSEECRRKSLYYSKKWFTNNN